MRDADPREERLPAWAQHRIRALRSALAAAEARLNAGSEDALAFASPFDDVPTPLRDPHVAFGRPDRRSGAFRVRLRESGALEVSTGVAMLGIHPRSSNLVEIVEVDL